ncbi:serine hydrolase domain-containing protein [Nocardioides sp. B-3]|uniref:serine hydrolase domain-containing protein n=1 Tax=Nocardioides sp. B-3 TaxID=2895565 RepID=UPI002153469F|nr:serine hydrolase domain-containing protein [Nocardioides sp. B-3]UUZ58330.1 beta-lactamase family protein [Nocardioides sp. B-3]
MSIVEAELERGVRRRAGLVIGVLRDGLPTVRGRAADGGVLDGQSIFEIGSITKTFTSLLLADGVVRGDWSLATPVRDLLPAGTRVPSRDGVEITLEHLATHTSGLPGAAVPVVRGSVEMLRGRDPYARLTTDDLLLVLSRSQLKRTPGTPAVHYSNLGVGVLGQAMAHASGTPYADLLATRVLRPLGLADTATHARLDPVQRSRLVPGHRGRGRPAAARPLEGMPAAGALRSTADDMLRYPAAQLDPDQSPLGEAIRLTHVLREDKLLTVGPGWMRIDKPRMLWWHNGGTGGYRSFVGFRPDRRDAVVVLSNQSRGVDLVGLRVLKSLD